MDSGNQEFFTFWIRPGAKGTGVGALGGLMAEAVLKWLLALSNQSDAIP